jgi:hypothetical protein
LIAFEKEHPAEFLALMHISNEETKRKVATDADRFLALHKLYKLRWAQSISNDTLKANRNRLMGPDSHTRRGLSNLSRNQDLSNAIAIMLVQPYMHNTFHAGAWRKLTQGKFYKVNPYV